MQHLAIMDNLTINKILNGEKLIESRFSKKKIAPFNRIKKEDIVFLKLTGGSVVASFVVEKVLYLQDLTNLEFKNIKNKFGKMINAPEEYWLLKKDSRYATLIYIKNAKVIKPIKINKKNRSGFVSSDNLFNKYNVM